MNHKKKNRRQSNNGGIEGNEEKARKLKQQDIKDLDKLESQIRQCFGSVTYTQMTHEKCADNSKKSYNRFKNWQIILSTATTVFILAGIISSGKIFSSIALVFSMILLSINLYSREFSLGAVFEKHSNMARNLWDLRECYLSLLTDLKAGYLGLQEIQVKRDMFQERMMEIYSGAPKIDVKIYGKVRKSLEEIEQPTLSDEEIDKMLPEHLKSVQ